MGLLGLFAVAFLVAFAFQWFRRWWWVSVSLPTFGFVSSILLDEFVLPYRGGGASMWPLALLFGVPTAIAGSLLGLFFAWLLRPDRQVKNAL